MLPTCCQQEGWAVQLCISICTMCTIIDVSRHFQIMAVSNGLLTCFLRQRALQDCLEEQLSLGSRQGGMTDISKVLHRIREQDIRMRDDSGHSATDARMSGVGAKCTSIMT